MTLKLFFFKKTKVLLSFSLIFCLNDLKLLIFYLLLLSVINEKSNTAMSALEAGAIEPPLSGKIRLYVFDSVFSQILIEFLFVVFICLFDFFCEKNRNMAGLNAHL